MDENGKHVGIGGGGTGTMVTPSHATYDKSIDFNNITAYGVYNLRIGPDSTNGPVDTSLNGGMFVISSRFRQIGVSDCIFPRHKS